MNTAILIQRWCAAPWYEKIGICIGFCVLAILLIATSPIWLIVWGGSCLDRFWSDQP